MNCDRAAIVQFPHPGAEHNAKHKQPIFPWNTGKHHRKYMRVPGSYVDASGELVHAPVSFWGEWEAPSRVVKTWKSETDLPTYLHEPYWEDPQFEGFRQNTDPLGLRGLLPLQQLQTRQPERPSASAAGIDGPVRQHPRRGVRLSLLNSSIVRRRFPPELSAPPLGVQLEFSRRPEPDQAWFKRIQVKINWSPTIVEWLRRLGGPHFA